MAGALDSEAPTRGLRKKERTRRQLVEAGLRVLAERGEALTVNDVVQAAGVSNGTFYNYFSDRGDLVEGLAAELLRMLAEAAAREPVEDPAERFATASAVVLRRAAEDPTWGRAVLRLLHRPSVAGDFDRFLRQDLDEGRRRGRFGVGADDVTVDLVVGLLMMTIRRLVEGEPARETIVRALERALGSLGVEAGEARSLADAGWQASAPR